MRYIISILILVLPLALFADRPRIIQHNFDNFTVWVDCSQRGPIAFQYWVRDDIGNLDPSSSSESVSLDSWVGAVRHVFSFDA